MRLLPAAAAIALSLPALTSLAGSDKDAELHRQLVIFNNIVSRLEDNYVDSIPTRRAMENAINGLLYEIDPYTEYYTDEDLENFKTETTGEYAGVGSYISQRDSMVYFSDPFEGSPAAMAGIRSGDRILKIDTVELGRTTSERVTKLLKGPAGTPVTVTVSRPYVGPDSLLTFTVIRAKLSLPSVPYAGVVDGVGYISLTSFMETSPQEVKKALEAFKGDPEVKGVVLDLRGNGGGLVQSAVEIAGYFLPKGTEVLRTQGRKNTKPKIYRTTHTPILPEMPLAILIDGASASASEIVAGAMQDLDRAVLIGSRSFGKGLVQSTLELPYGKMLKVTTAKYYIPSGRLIQALDYSNRNPDGSVAPTPDSLCNVFHTAHGREVKDGGGLTPEIKIDWGTPSRLVFNLVRDFWIDDYATRYAATHPSIPGPAEFTVTDSIYDDFTAGIDPGRLKYDKVCEEMLSRLEETAKTEGYMNDSTKAQFEVMRRLLTHNLQQDLRTHRKEIATFLGEEIVGRYYYQRGKTRNGLLNDEAFDTAVNLLHDAAARKELGILY